MMCAGAQWRVAPTSLPASESTPACLRQPAHARAEPVRLPQQRRAAAPRPARRPPLLPRPPPPPPPLARRGPHSIGSHVRDAAAYVCWAAARAYAPELLAAHVQRLAASLLAAACYDREVNCRRAAAAAFQESVGRLGSFPHGIALMAVTDYFSVGNLAGAYLQVRAAARRLCAAAGWLAAWLGAAACWLCAAAGWLCVAAGWLAAWRLRGGAVQRACAAGLCSGAAQAAAAARPALTRAGALPALRAPCAPARPPALPCPRPAGGAPGGGVPRVHAAAGRPPAGHAAAALGEVAARAGGAGAGGAGALPPPALRACLPRRRPPGARGLQACGGAQCSPRRACALSEPTAPPPSPPTPTTPAHTPAGADAARLLLRRRPGPAAAAVPGPGAGGQARRAGRHLPAAARPRGGGPGGQRRAARQGGRGGAPDRGGQAAEGQGWGAALRCCMRARCWAGASPRCGRLPAGCSRPRSYRAPRTHQGPGPPQAAS
jgi:hypothetical protein